MRPVEIDRRSWYNSTMRKILSFLLCLLLLSFLSAHSDQDLQEDFEAGKIIDKVVCQKRLNQSYALYLPPAYTPGKEWPILYAADPGARGRIPLEKFQSAAEKYGYILAGSNNARNGPWEPVIHALKSVWDDTNTRFSIDQERVYVAGFSGGSRAASVFSKIIKQPVAGIIGCGAGLAKDMIKPEEIVPAYYFGVVGSEDFNYQEMMRLDDEFDKHDVHHRFLVFDGEHEWLSPELSTRVIGWMEIVGMRRNLRPKDHGLIQEIYEKEITQAEALESSGQILQALSIYEALASLYQGWPGAEGIVTRIQRTKRSSAYKRALEEEKNISERELSLISNFVGVFNQMENGSTPLPDLNRFFRDLRLDEILKKVKSRNSKERNMAVRLLHSLENNASRKGWVYFNNQDNDKAMLAFEVALKASRKDSYRRPYLFYNLACAYARNQNPKRALKNLKLAVESGFADLAHIQQDEDLEGLRNTPEFADIIELLKKK